MQGTRRGVAPIKRNERMPSVVPKSQTEFGRLVAVREEAWIRR
jgi:hypothetical protein